MRQNCDSTSFKKNLENLNVQYAFGSEDAIGVIRKIKYDSTTNTFNGFSTPLDKSSLLDVHMIQLLQSLNQSTIPSPFLLSAYGIDNTATANDVLHRWWYIFNQCLQRNVRIIGFSTGKKIINFINLNLTEECYRRCLPHLSFLSFFSLSLDVLDRR